ncbi:MAG: sterol desaturase family protein [Pseudomonadota bacterium]
MDLIALAIPFFILALVVEWTYDRVRGTGFYRVNDAVNSISTGIMSTTFGYFTKFTSILIWGLVLQHVAVFDMPLAWFDASLRGIALWAIAALLWDLAYYWNHRLNHEVSVLWASHAVHHQSEDYNLSTALRQTSTGFLFGWIFYVPLFVIGFPIEVVVTVGAANLIYQFWVHTQVVRRLGVLDYIFVTPSNHRVHHAQNEQYIDKNYGGILILWDRLFGTFADEKDDDPVVFGVRKPLASWNPFWANLQVYDYLLFDAVRTRRWRDKIGVWFRRTGWRPPDVAAAYPKGQTASVEFEKFDPRISSAARHYVVLQFVIAIAASVVIGGIFATQGAAAVLLPCLLLWAQLLGMGLVNEGRRYAVPIEWGRLAGVSALLAGAWLTRTAATDTQWLQIGAAYVAISAGMLFRINNLKQ